MDMFTEIVLLAMFLTLYFGVVRSEVTYFIRMHFINTDDLYPIAFRTLPSYGAMMFHPRYQLLWTKAQWVKWVKAQGVAA